MNLMTLIALISSALLLLIFLAGRRYQAVDWGHPVMNWIDGWNRFFCHWFHGLALDSIQLPEGPLLLISNHCSGLDPFLLIAASNRPLRFIIAKEEFERPILNKLFKLSGCIPVDRSGRVEIAFREALKHLKNGEVVALFPHGKIHLDEEPFKPLKRGVFKLSKLSQCDIHPFRIEGVTLEGSVGLSLIVPSKVRIQTLATNNYLQVQNSSEQKNIAMKILGK